MLIDNPEKKVIAPKKWFGKQYDHYHMDDLIPETWTVLDGSHLFDSY